MTAKRQELVKEFSNITGADDGTAKHFLDAYADNLQTAVAMFLDDKTEDASLLKNVPDEDTVRAPIPQTSGVLVDDPNYVTTSNDRWNSRRRPRSVFDGFRDFKAETSHQEALLSINPDRSRRLKRLEDLFRPPLELMHRGTLETARESGRQLNKWLMINVQNVREFSCQVLNRDVWSKPSIQRKIKEHFIFWQIYNDSTEGDRFITFYPVSSWPHVSILDPRTGERLASWNEITRNNLEGKVEEFLADHGKIGEEENDAGPPTKKTKRDHILIDDSEDSQLAAAIAASLKETKAPPEEAAVFDNDDSDFIASNDCSDVSGFDGTSDEENLIVDSDSNDPAPILKKNDDRTTKDNELLDLTKIDEDFFSSEDAKNCTKTPKNSFNRHNGTSKPNFIAEKLEKSQKTSYKKVNAKLKVGTVENGKDMSNLTNDIYGDPNFKPSPVPQDAVATADVCRIMVRYPDGTREEIMMEIDATVKDLSADLTRKGYPAQDYDVITNFPRKSIFSFGMKKTLKQAGLYPRAAVFVEEKECG